VAKVLSRGEEEGEKKKLREKPIEEEEDFRPTCEYWPKKRRRGNQSRPDERENEISQRDNRWVHFGLKRGEKNEKA